MYHCILCHQQVELDDVVVQKRSHGVCICLRCYHRETETSTPINKAIAQQWIDAAGKE